MDCRSARVAIDRQAVDPAVQAHIESCAACQQERRLAVALRSALIVDAPPELSARLLALATPAPPSRVDAALKQALVVPVPPKLSRQLQMLVPGAPPVQTVRRPWVMPVYALTVVLLGVVLFFAGQVYGLALQELGVSELWQAAAQLPQQWLDQFYVFFPQGRYVVGMFLALQQALQWVLVGLVMWAVLEMGTLQRAQRITS